jgi:hypothetical protein
MQREDSLKRRSLLKSIGAAGSGAAAFSGSSLAQSDTNRTATTLSGTNREQLIEEFSSQSGVQKVADALRERGWTANLRNSTVTRIEPENERNYHFVLNTLSKTSAGRSEQAVLLWFDRTPPNVDMPLTLGREFQISTRQISRLSSDPTTVESNPEWAVESIYVKNDNLHRESSRVTSTGTVSTDETTIEPDAVAPAPSPPAGCDSCIVDYYVCDSIDWSCITSTAASVVGSGVTCGACLADPTKLTCFLCAGYVSGGALSTADCVSNHDPNFYQDECTEETRYVCKDEAHPEFDWPGDCKYR